MIRPKNKTKQNPYCAHERAHMQTQTQTHKQGTHAHTNTNETGAILEMQL